jgi:hypothetical protein
MLFDSPEGHISTRSPTKSVYPETMADTQKRDYYEGQSEEEEEEEEDTMEDLSDADAQSLMEPAISQTVTSQKSPATPAAYRAAAFASLENEGYFSSDGDITPPAPPPPTDASINPTVQLPEHLRNSEKVESPLSLGSLPARDLENTEFPSPWVAGPKPFPIPARPAEGRSALKDALATARPRSSSWGSDAFRKLLPSKPKPGSFIPNTSFFSSIGDGKRSRGFSQSKDQLPQSNSSQVFPDAESRHPSPQAFSSNNSATTLRSGQPATPKVPAVRRIASDESLLYHSISRTSSLGDDSRFEDQHVQVNSRGKALRDSLADRSSFRLPAMPNMPSMPSIPRVSNFTLAMNFASSYKNNDAPPVKWKGYADSDSMKGILPGNAKKKSSLLSNMGPSNGADGIPSGSNPDLTKEILSTDGAILTFLDRAIEDLTGDVVIMGGYRGSILRSTKTKQQLWAPVKMGLGIRKVNIEVGLEPEDEERMEETIYPAGMLKNVSLITLYKLRIGLQ